MTHEELIRVLKTHINTLPRSGINIRFHDDEILFLDVRSSSCDDAEVKYAELWRPISDAVAEMVVENAIRRELDHRCYQYSWTYTCYPIGDGSFASFASRDSDSATTDTFYAPTSLESLLLLLTEIYDRKEKAIVSNE